MRFAAFTLVVATACFFVGYRMGRSRVASADPGLADTAAAPPPTACAVTIDPMTLRQEISRALGSVSGGKLAEMVASSATGTAPPGAAEPRATPTPAQVAAFDRARPLVERVLGQGRMSVVESRELRRVMDAMDETSRLETTRRLIQALNQGKLTVEDRELPF